jgi:hypothetical protein
MDFSLRNEDGQWQTSPTPPINYGQPHPGILRDGTPGSSNLNSHGGQPAKMVYYLLWRWSRITVEGPRLMTNYKLANVLAAFVENWKPRGSQVEIHSAILSTHGLSRSRFDPIKRLAHHALKGRVIVDVVVPGICDSAVKNQIGNSKSQWFAAP